MQNPIPFSLSRNIYSPRHYEQQDTPVLGTLIFIEIHRRILKGKFGKIPQPIQDWCFAEGRYCLDAPETIPAGGCEFFYLDSTGLEGDLNEFGHFGCPTQLTIQRSEFIA
jgi:hypothetical protein